MTRTISRRRFIQNGSAFALGISLGCSVKPRFDVIIKGGLLYDGTGSDPVTTDIGITGNTVTAIGDLGKASAKRAIDAANRAVCPGFIDIHTHTDMELFVNPRAESKIRQGVTTEVGGNCGSSPFPLNDADYTDYSKRSMDRYQVDVTWRKLDGFLNALEKNGTALNFATLTGHGDLRSCVVGKNDVSPTPEQLGQMKALLQESLEQGSFGMSTGLEYAPGSYARTDELIALCEVVARHGGLYATHMRNEDDFVEEAIEEALEISRKSQAALQISHLKACNPKNWHKTPRFLERIQKAIDEGMPVHADRYPYIAYGTGLSVFIPLHTRQGTTEEIMARLRDPRELKKIKPYTAQRGERIGGWDNVKISSCFTEKNKALEGLSITEAAEHNGMAPIDFIIRLLLEEEDRVGIVGFAMSEDNLKSVLSAPFVMVGSDGNAAAPYGKLGTGKPHPRYYGTFPRVLGKYARDEQIFDLSTAIGKMTSMPAQKLGLQRRGQLAPGYFADVVVFDPETVMDRATFVAPHQYPAGIEYVLVNGKITIENGEHTGVLAGSVLRSGTV